VSLTTELMAGYPWSEWYVLQFLQDLLEVLSFVHHFQQGYIHRDVKPSNIIRRKSDGKCVLIDFGSVKQITQQFIQTQTVITPTVIVGTLGYMPCEQLQGKPRKTSDVYAVGMIALYALTGQNPALAPLIHDPDTGRIPWRDRTDVSPELATIIDQMVAHDFRQRYPSAQEALAAVQQLIQVRQSFEPTVVSSTSLKSKVTSDSMAQKIAPPSEVNLAQTSDQNAMDSSPDTLLDTLSWGQILNHFTSLFGLRLFQAIQKGTTPENLGKVKLVAQFSLPILVLGAMIASPHLEWLCCPLDNCSLDVKSRNIFDLSPLQRR
jgi:serine/threonine protein kinase